MLAAADAAASTLPAPVPPSPSGGGGWGERSRRPPLAEWAAPAALILALLVGCQAVTALFAVPRWLLPAPSDVGAAFVSAGGLFADHTATTLQETALGFALAVAVGLGFALLLDASALVRRTVYPLLVASQTVPIIAIAPLLVIWFGYGLLPKVLIVALVCFFPIVVGTLDGLRGVEPELIDLVRSLGAGRWTTLRLVRWPAALPGFFSGLRIAVTYSVIGAVVGEWVGASKGLGVLMIRSIDQFLTDRVFAAIAVCSLLSIALFLLVAAVERLVVPWRYRESSFQPSGISRQGGVRRDVRRRGPRADGPWRQ